MPCYMPRCALKIVYIQIHIYIQFLAQFEACMNDYDDGMMNGLRGATRAIILGGAFLRYSEFTLKLSYKWFTEHTRPYSTNAQERRVAAINLNRQILQHRACCGNSGVAHVCISMHLYYNIQCVSV